MHARLHWQAICCCRCNAPGLSRAPVRGTRSAGTLVEALLEAGVEPRHTGAITEALAEQQQQQQQQQQHAVDHGEPAAPTFTAGGIYNPVFLSVRDQA